MSQVSCEWKVRMRRELRGMLDASANRPADERFDWWPGVVWSKVEADVRALRQRIFTAAKDADHKRVRSLQRLMLRSRANVLVSVRRVTQDNAGRHTAGVDGVVVLDDESRTAMVQWPELKQSQLIMAAMR
ncbi:reverse transcriptase N-terminal domain-containing protein [Solwaraspora sp. WMMB762]|uniref:reverse transcriptase N-terminal domain-containing protein n=1 Tax=Solwaraspora sp. WMMB762 TaxID=3404120 RepID=UPI003B9498DC